MTRPAPRARSDDELSRRLTEVLRTAPGVVDVFDARPLAEGVARAVAEGLDLVPPAGLVHVSGDEGHATAAAHVATDVGRPAPEVLAGAAALLRQHLAELGEDASTWTVRVTVRLVDGR